MPRIRVPLNNFAFGEINPSLTSRVDSPVYNQAAESVKNFFIRAEGGVIKRPATKRIHNFGHTFDSALTQQIRIEPFVFSDDEKYIVAFSSGQLDIFRIVASTNAVSHIQTITVDVDSASLPITNTNINQLTFAQRGDFMFIAHTSFLCRLLVRTGLTTFEVRLFSFDTDIAGERVFQPYYNFQSSSTSLSSSATSGTGVTLTTSADYFTSNHVGVRLQIGETEATITAVTDAKNVTADIHGTLKTQLDVDALQTKDGSNKVEVTHALHGLAVGASVTIAEAGGVGGIGAGNINGARTINRIIDDNRYEITAGSSATSEAIGGGSPTVESSAATTEWFEQSYSPLRGFPAAVTFHEDRLWFGGTPSQPDGLWGSVTGEYFNFDLGDAEDNDALDLDANIGATNQIRHLVSNRDLQVFASQSEFFLPSFTDKPVTPANAKISAQTPFGSGFVRPQSLDGATMFVQGTGTAVREYIFSDAEGAYTGNMISLLSSHLINAPIQLATIKGSLDRPGAYGFFLMNNGEIGVFYSIRSEKRAGWMRWETTGSFHSICSVDEDLYCVSARDDGSGTTKLFLERFQTDMAMDFGDDFTGTAGVFTVSSHFADGAVVDVTDGTEYLGQFTVASGQLDVSAVKPSTSVQAGYKFVPELRTLPIDAQVQGGFLTARPRRISLVDLDLNETLSVSVNGTDMIIRNVNFAVGGSVSKITGKKEFRPLGYSKDPRVTISQSAPLPLQINGLIAEVAF
ncbi:MAG: hypothetical protein CL525_16310 [Aequorivita sp.]|nr:hypothetical protein [Aequorivita sp.]